MVLIMSFIVGVLFGGGVYLMQYRSLVRIILGLVLIAHAVNLGIFIMGDGFVRGNPAFIPPGEEAPPAVWSDPLPQALVLTAIVISFGITAFMLALAYRTAQTVGTDDPDELNTTEKL